MNDIKRVMIVDDQPDMRRTITAQVEDANLIPIIQNDRILSLDSCIKNIQDNADAAIFDHDLTNKNYANFKGTQAVKILYGLSIPILLATSYFNSKIFEIREYRQYIPVIIDAEINPDIIINGFKLCQNEYSGIFSPERKPWRSLVRVEEVIDNTIYVVVPSWNTSKKISLPISMFPEEYKQSLEPDLHFFAQVNVDAERYEDLYFHSFEPIKQLREKYARFIHS